MLQFLPASAYQADRSTQEIQDPSKTHPAYSGAEKGGSHEVPTADEGVERDVVWGRNVPSSTGQAAEEFKHVSVDRRSR